MALCQIDESGNDFYVVSDVTTSPRDWCVLQYHRPNEQDGMVVAFRRHESPYSGFTAELREIDRTADYDVMRSPGYEPSAPVRVRGADVAKLKIDIDEHPGSIVIEYKKVSD